MNWESSEGCPYPLGVSWVECEQAYNFAIYSKHAERVSLLLYKQDDCVQPIYRQALDYLKNKSGSIWHCRVRADDAGDARFYAYQIDGPPPASGFNWHSFDAEKILLDPYARAVFFPPHFDRQAAIEPGSNAGRAPLGLLPQSTPTIAEARSSEQPHHQSDLVIYEMHVGGFTRHASSSVAEAERGTFRGVIEKIPYLRELGVTAVELMPVQQFDPQDGNYWGYMPLNLFSPQDGYSSRSAPCCQLDEFREMVEALHAAGIEVILDVVYNHTCEGDERGPTYSFKGIDNTTYYMVSGDPNKPYCNFSGTGNSMHTANRAVRRMVLESLRYWAHELQVDGFRFDLASAFARNSDGSINTTDPPIFGQIAADDDLAHVRLIAEPWDAGGAYQLGRNFPGTKWMQWNGAYRDALQQVVRGDSSMVPELMTRIYGSSDLFPDDLSHAYHPYQSVNYVSSHDGFTLYDLVSFNYKNNWANGHENADGYNDFSWNCGWEGDDQVPADVMRLRKQQVKNFFCLLMLSAGTPMFRMGDEFLQTQRGNNNPYNQDNETTWLNWRRLDLHQDIFRFFKRMIRFRRSHPSIARSRFWRDDIHWFGPSRHVDMTAESRTLAYCLHGSSQRDDDLYVMVNASSEVVRFGLHEGRPDQWQCVIDTSHESPDDIRETPGGALEDHFYDVAARTVAVLVRDHNNS
ncbi:Glycogen debranching enzyme [Bremerella volcania]|uniref:Glycogen debranching enzyme n=1 Tax=Bremerella volcania TaxID=2527984 RepID=A0A518C5W4_9BACT|nr:isoamylase [Bremerella volcania]QDU74601.1 Glycogen debranching enzyme [Bremerella volcania]